jgi:hypothetical protein
MEKETQQEYFKILKIILSPIHFFLIFVALK